MTSHRRFPEMHLALSEEYLPQRGGHIVLLHELVRRIGPTCILTAGQNGAPSAETLDGVEVRRINLSRVGYLRPESLWMYANLLRCGAAIARARCPTAILAARCLPEGLVAAALGQWYRTASVIFAHGEEITPWLTADAAPQRRTLVSALKRRALWAAYRGASLIVANSRFTRRLLVEGGIDPSRIAIVHPGTDPHRYHPAPRQLSLVEEFGLAGKRVLLTVGRLIWRKGQDMVIRALPQVIAAVGDVVYLLVGMEEYGEDLRRLAARLGVSGHTRFLGQVSYDLLPAIYNLADVFVMPNRMSAESRDVEGFGIVFLEAGAAGLPVVGGRSGGTCDAVVDRETGLLVDGTDASQIAGALIRLLKDRELSRRLGEQGRARVCREFTWEHAAGRLRALLQQLDKTRRLSWETSQDDGRFARTFSTSRAHRPNPLLVCGSGETPPRT